ncbi:MAG: DUF4421 domain-containing protein [Prevotella sp.]|nr:DUF4421 domain-containing protein [Prevotella sp.]
MFRLLVIAIFVALPAHLLAQGDSIPKKKSFVGKAIDGLVGVVKEFNNIDTAFIEPQHYKFTTTLMSTYTFETYRIRSSSGQTVRFSPEANIKVGPYIGWSLLFWGYTIDLAYISANKKRELDLSVYTSMLGIDFFYRKSGHDYRIRSWDLGEGDSTVTGIPFDGLNVSITGLNGYYITNHRKFSYPAAFSQSTCQRRSAGSFMFGGGFTRHSLDLDYHKLQNALETASPDLSQKLDSGLLFNKIKYTDVSVSAGYGYNWVFSRNWLLSASLSASLAYKHSSGNHDPIDFFIDDFSISNFNFDGVGRLGVIWNDSKWYFGAYGVVHSYNYSKSRFATSNYFGNVKVYIGINFGRKKSHKKIPEQ